MPNLLNVSGSQKSVNVVLNNYRVDMTGSCRFNVTIYDMGDNVLISMTCTGIQFNSIPNPILPRSAFMYDVPNITGITNAYMVPFASFNAGGNYPMAVGIATIEINDDGLKMSVSGNMGSTTNLLFNQTFVLSKNNAQNIDLYEENYIEELLNDLDV